MNIRAYIQSLEAALKRGDATEHTYRPALKTLLETLAPDITATNEPRRTTCGAPDYIVTRGETPLGYIEAKDVGVNLEATLRTEQLGRYLHSLGVTTQVSEVRHERLTLEDTL